MGMKLEIDIELAERIQLLQNEVKKYKDAIAKLTKSNYKLGKILKDRSCKFEKDVNMKDQPLGNDPSSAGIGTAVYHGLRVCSRILWHTLIEIFGTCVCMSSKHVD
ncbi:hypothetical protein AVEN_148216-1 [Araneus ventricosus]|uniref:Uncharacterized protein n=1 Tax=Araneus ventricosus TaxID=182803 RepID=A0A4Y2DCD4_ARAVE|nr:hypothetical protein AVEN_148216-1 [Araneus ventricosus]